MMIDPALYSHCPYDGEKLVDNANDSAGHGRCPRCGFVDYQNPKVCVAILILRGAEVLLARRGVEPAKGEWDIPGGFVEAGESAAEAVVREALEETTLHIRIREYLGSIPDHYGVRRTPTLNLCYLVEVVGGTPQPKSDVESLAWFGLDDLPPKLAFAHQARAIQMVKERLIP